MNLSQWIRRHGSPDFRTGLTWMRQIASALKAASEAGIVHRDIKPENIMVTRNVVAKVTDFGARSTRAAKDRRQDESDSDRYHHGNAVVHEPEQIQGEKLDHRSDQYSLGVTCFHMFAGRPPFPVRTR